MNSESSNQEERIEAVLKEFENKEVTPETISAYTAYLETELEFPADVFCPVENEYYILYELEDSGDELYGTLAKLKLTSDERQQTILPLCEVRGVENRSKIFQLIKDYSTWFVNYQ